MRKVILIFAFLLISIAAYSQDKVPATLFHSTHCKMCLELKEEFLPEIKEKYKDEIQWNELETSQNPDNLSFLLSLVERFKTESALVPAVWVGDNFLVGAKDIKDKLEIAIIEELAKGSRSTKLYKKDLLSFFKGISVFAVIGSGLIDGINPCAFAVIVFFISFLAVYGYGKREIICVGLAYCSAVFLTYLLLGLGFFKFLYAFKHIYLLIKTFYYFIAFFCFLMAIFAFIDYFRFRKTKSAEQAILQLPKFLKKKINKVIGSGLRGKKHTSMIALGFASFGIGFLVSLLEAVCTGQVYLPTIVFILKSTDLKLKALTYLLIYNLMFILPLVVVFVLSLLGVGSAKFNKFLKENLGRIKIMLAIVFLSLGILILCLG